MTIYPESLKPILDRIDPTFGRFLDCDAGWWPLIEKMHNELIALDPDYRIYQVKEKFGGLRLYFCPSNPDMSQQMQDIANYYERRSFSVCEMTGDPGQLMVNNGRFRTLCKACAGDEWEVVENL